MAEIFDFRAFQSARDQARKLGTNATMAIIRKVREEQRAGRTGNAVAAELQRARLSVAPFGPTGPEAA